MDDSDVTPNIGCKVVSPSYMMLYFLVFAPSKYSYVLSSCPSFLLVLLFLANLANGRAPPIDVIESAWIKSAQDQDRDWSRLERSSLYVC